MTTDARRRHLSLLAAQDLERAAQSRRSVATATADVAFWLVYGGGMALIAYIAFCSRR